MHVRHIAENQWMKAVFLLMGHVGLSICRIKCVYKTSLWSSRSPQSSQGSEEVRRRLIWGKSSGLFSLILFIKKKFFF